MISIFAYLACDEAIDARRVRHRYMTWSPGGTIRRQTSLRKGSFVIMSFVPRILIACFGTVSASAYVIRCALCLQFGLGMNLLSFLKHAGRICNDGKWDYCTCMMLSLFQFLHFSLCYIYSLSFVSNLPNLSVC